MASKSPALFYGDTERQLKNIFKKVHIMNDKQKKLWDLAASIDCSPEILTRLSNSNDSHLLRLVCGNINTPEHVLLRLAHDISPYVRYGVAKSVNVPLEALDVLCSSNEYDILKLVVMNPSISERSLLKIINGSHERQGSLITVACANIALRTSTIKRLLPTACSNMKRGFALNVNTATKELCTLASDSAFVRYSVALRSNFPNAVCDILKQETNIDVQRALFDNEFVPNSVIEHVFDYDPNRLVELVSSRKDLPPSVQGKIIYGDNPYAKVLLLKSSLLTAIQLEYLANDDSHLVRIEVAKQVNISEKTMNILKVDPSSQVVVEVVRNPFVSVDVLVALSEHENSLVRTEVALKENITECLCYELSADESPQVKKALIKNPNAFLDAVSDLVFDVDDGVSRLAKLLLSKECVVNSKYEYMAG